MNEPAPPRHDPFAALRQPSFVIYSAGRFCSGMANTLQSAAISWQIWDLTHSSWYILFIGLVRFLPSLGLSLVAGAIADSFDRRMLAIASQLVQLAAAFALMVVTVSGHHNLAVIYSSVFVVALGATFEWPARSALLPMLVKPETFGNAIVVSGTVQQLSFVSGPLLGALFIAVSGVGLAYTALCFLFGASILALALLRPRKDEGLRRAVNIAGVIEGVRFVWGRKVLLGAMTLDMFAVIFGGATALLPIYSREILDVGAWGFGLLLGAIEGGSFLMSIVMILVRPPRRPGLVLIYAVLGFGLATIIFGLSRNFALSLAACALIGMSDQVSVVMRNTTIQLATPDELRGRVTSVNMLFIGASNQLGTVESGGVAALTSATFAVVSGGVGCLAVLGAVTAAIPDLRRYRLPSVAGGYDVDEETAAAPGGAAAVSQTPAKPGEVLVADASEPS